MRFRNDMGIDLGTASILVFLRNKGIVLNEPSVVAIEQRSRKVVAVGEQAQRMLGRTPGNIIATRPLKDGVIADFDLTEIMLKHFIEKVCYRKSILRPRVVVCIPAGTTSVEKKAVIEAVTRTGAKEAYLIEEPRAAALGAGLEIFEPSGNMVIDIGGGTTDVAVLSLGEVVVSCSVRTGGDKFDNAIMRYVKKEFNILIGDQTAEKLKIEIGSAFPGSRDLSKEVRGRDLVTGLPRALTLTTAQIVEALEESLWDITQGVKQVLEQTPPELAGDVIEKGIVLTGGGAMLDGLHKLITKETGVAAFLAENPIGCVALGTGKTLEVIDEISQSLISKDNLAASL